MKISNKAKVLTAIIILIFLFFLFFEQIRTRVIGYYNLNVRQDYDELIQETLNWELKSNIRFNTNTISFNRNGINNIVFITMVKEEEDIIYENLVWHFCIGFRKFIIIDNNSQDNTGYLINKFKDKVKEKAQVIVINDPIIEHIQSGFITGSMKLAAHIWPTVKWVFPVDGDEFLYPTRKLNEILQNIPEDKNTILVTQYNYVPVVKANNFNGFLPFYKTIKHRLKSSTKDMALSDDMGKIATKPALDITIAQGNHSINKSNDSTNSYPNYISGNIIGLNMLHFQRRSIKQIQRKYLNGANANILGQEKGLIKAGDGFHWNSFLSEVENKGLYQAAEDRFNEFTTDKDDCIEDPVPIDTALKLFEQIVNNTDI